MIPILVNHDVKHVIGKCEFENDSLIITFMRDARITKEIMLNVFSNFSILEYEIENDEIFIIKAQIIAFSVSNKEGL